MDNKDELEKDIESTDFDEELDDLDNETFTYKIDNNNVSNDYNKNYSNNNKSTLYIVIGVVILIGIISLLIFIANRGGSKFHSYSKVEDSMVSGAKSYYKKYISELPTIDGGSVSVSADTLIENSFLKPFSELVGKDVSCSGYVKVYNVNDNYSYFPYLSCSGEYESLTLSKKITSSLVSSGDGLYSYGGKYVYRGEYPNNYIKFNDKMWRIIGVNVDGSVKIIYSDKKIERNSWDDRYNSDKDSYYGINDFRVSRLLEYLNNVYEKNTYVSNSNKGLLVKYDWCIGKISQNDSLISSLNLCSDTYSDLYIGVVQVDEVLLPSLDTKCINVYDTECTNYNYFFNINTGWTLNASADNTYTAFNSNGGSVSFKRTSNEGYIRPVVNLNSNVLYKSGTGTSDDPYIIGY